MHRVLKSGLDPELGPGLCALAIMTKAPRAGAVKTRLQPPLTPEEAAALNVCFLRDTANAVIGAGKNSRAVAVFTPVGAAQAYESILPPEFVLIPQRGEFFGERLRFATGDLLQAGFESCCLIDSDSPTVPAEIFRAAADALQSGDDRIVLGPSEDGGYYLIGMSKLHPEVFEHISWSTEHVLEQTIEKAKTNDLEVHLLPTFFDVDDAATLRRLCEEVLHDDRALAPATKEYLAEFIARGGRQRIWPAKA